MAISANFTTSTDEDWFTVQLLAGVTYRITVSPDNPLNLLSLDAFSTEDSTGLFVGGGGGRSESSEQSVDGIEQLVFTPRTDSTYFIQTMQFGNEAEPVSYTVSAEMISDDYPDNVDTTGSLAVGGQAQGVLEAAGDEDWFKTELQAGVTYQFVVSSDGDEPPRLSASSSEDTGNYLQIDGGRTESGTFSVDGTTNSMVFTPQLDSMYYLSVGDTSSATGNYNVTLNEIVDDFADNTDTTGELSVGGQLAGTIEAEDDADFIKMELAPNSTYHITVDASEDAFILPQLFSLEDGTGLTTLGEDFRFEIASFGVAQTTSSITFSTFDGGTYFLNVGSTALQTDEFSPVDYTVNLEMVADDYVDTTLTNGVLTVGGQIAGTIETINDNDWFRAELQGGVTYVVRVDAEDAGPSLEDLLEQQTEITLQLADPELTEEEQAELLEQLDALAEQIANFDFIEALPFRVNGASDNDLNAMIDLDGRIEFVSTGPFGASYSQLVFTPRQDSTYYFDVSHDSTRTGDYTLSLDMVADDFADSIETTGSVTVGGQASGHIDAFGDADWFATELDAGVSYLVTVELTSESTEFVSPLLVTVSSSEDSDGIGAEFNLDQEGAQLRLELALFETATESKVLFTPFEGGTYYVQVDGLVTDDVDYTVQVAEIEDDHPDNTATTGVLTVSAGGGGEGNNNPTGDVLIIGSPTVGEILSADTGTLADADGLGAFSYQWLRDGAAITGAVADSYTLSQEDVGTAISVRVSYTDGGGTEEMLTSDETAAIAEAGNDNNAPSGNVVISGSPTEGETLGADSSSVADADGLGAFSYQWLRDGAAIAGAVADSYSLSQEDVGTAISVQVSYTDGGGTEESIISAATAAVEGLSEPNTVDGTAEDDQLIGSAGDDDVFGGDGDDVFLLSNLPSQYSYDNGVVAGTEGNDSLNDVEYVGFGFNFDDPVFEVMVDPMDLVDPDGSGPEKSYVADLLDKITDLYTAYFGRAPDVKGLIYWFKQIYTGALTLDLTAKSFSDQPEYMSTYPEGSSNLDFITAIYQNLFNRNPDGPGAEYWDGQLSNGMPRDTFILAVINGAYAPTGGAEDRALLTNKHDVSIYLAERSSLDPDEEIDFDSVNELLSAVTADAASVETAREIIDHAFENDPLTLTGIVEDPALWDSFWAA